MYATRTHIANTAQFKTIAFHADGMNSDIISAIHAALPAATEQVKPFAQTFRGATVTATANNIFTWLKNNIKYKRDPLTLQLIKLPARLAADGTGDCKSYSLFTAAVLRALGMPVTFRYTSYDSDPTPVHVYTLTNDNSTPVLIDAVWNRFNSEKPYTHKHDYKMNIATIAGFMTPSSSANIPALAVSPDATDRANAIVEYSKISGVGFVMPQINGPLDAAVTAVLNTVSTNAEKAAGLYDKLPTALQKLYNNRATSLFVQPRTAFTLLVATNVKGLASILQVAAQKDGAKLERLLKLFGFNYQSILSIINKGATKKPLLANFKIPGIGEVATATAATGANAAVILTAVAGLIAAYAASLPKTDADGNPIPGSAGGNGLKNNIPDGGNYAPGFMDDFFTNPVKLIGAGALAYFGGKALKIF